MFASWKKSYDQPRQHIEKQKHCFANKSLSSQSYGFSSSHVWMYGYRKLSARELLLLNCCVGEDSWESRGLQGDQEIKPINCKGNQSWIFIGKTDAEAESLILWPPIVKNWHIGKDPDAGKDWGQENRMTDGEMVGWHHGLDGHEFKQAPRVGDGQGTLLCFSPWCCKQLDTDWATELNWTECSSVITNTPLWWRMLIMVKLACLGVGSLGLSLYLPLNFTVYLKLL